jgi:hypothetical protein
MIAINAAGSIYSQLTIRRIYAYLRWGKTHIKMDYYRLGKLDGVERGT